MSLSSLHVHLVFSTKCRRPIISDALRPALHAYLGGILRELRGKAVIVNGTRDHVHIVATIPATLCVADLLRVLKANSSKWMNDHGKDFAWQKGYAAFTVSTSNMPAVAAYIRDQEKHHRKRSFEDELVALLRRHGVTYDPSISSIDSFAPSGLASLSRLTHGLRRGLHIVPRPSGADHAGTREGACAAAISPTLRQHQAKGRATRPKYLFD